MKQFPLLIPFAVLAFAACTPPEQSPRKEATIVAPPAYLRTKSEPLEQQAVIGPRDLFGQWQVVGLTGANLAESHPIHMLIGLDRVEATSQCIRSALRLIS
jgi:hypothetical protein